MSARRHLLAAVALFACAAGARAQCAQPVPPSAYWKSSLRVPYEPWAHSTGPGPSWVKFTIRTCDPTEAHFQLASQYLFHAQFATSEVPPFIGMTPAEFDDVSLHAAGQQAVLGAVLMPTFGAPLQDEIGIQLVREDPYPSAEAIALIQLVASRVTGESRVLYMPTYTQRAQAEADRALFDASGIEIASPDRWSSGNSCYAKGWALGRLQHVLAADIEAAWLSGRLLPTDILLTDEVPADVPPVAGIATFVSATPSSHVALLADTWRIPFVHLALVADRDHALSLVGQRVVLRADELFNQCRVRLIQVDGRVDEASIAELLALKAPQPLDYQPIQPFGALATSAEGLTFDDIHRFGGKSSGFGLLRRTIPASSPVAAAFSFDLWIGFLDQVLVSGLSLREEIRRRLAPHPWPPDMLALSIELDAIRTMIRDAAQTSFTPAQQAGILATLQDPQYAFDPARNIRFRSSTNMEDAAQFTGAGLYDSFSGCLADELDADTVGPSICDPTEANERGVYRAIRRVLASFYNDNAYLERLRHGVVEDEVGMAMLVHHSFPDPFEMANGVGTLSEPGVFDVDMKLVTQQGAVSVTNPAGGARPEVVHVYDFGFDSPGLLQESSLVQLGATVMTWEDDYLELAALFRAVAAGYAAETGESTYILDFEYKKLRPDGDIEVKQVRRLPLPSAATITPFLINEPITLEAAQAEGQLELSLHRLKSRLTLASQNTWLTPAVLQQGFLAEVRHEHVDGCSVNVQEGPMPGWPGARHSYDAATLQSRDAWTLPGRGNAQENTLVLYEVPSVVPRDNPIRVLSDFGWGSPVATLEARHAVPVTHHDWPGWDVTLAESVVLWPPLAPSALDIPVRRSIADAADGVTVTTDFRWPPPPGGIVAGYTAPAVGFDRTTIEGLTTTPLVLTSPWSQTYRPQHHNFAEDFVFDPRLDPGVTQVQLDELAARGIRGLHAAWPMDEITLLTDALWANTCAGCIDADRDGHCVDGTEPDCDDADGASWATPQEVVDLRVTDAIRWSLPAQPGGSSLLFDTLRSRDPGDFTSGSPCLESSGADRVSLDPATPGPGAAFYYLVRAMNACPLGAGDLGTDSLGGPRLGAACP